MKTRIGIVLLLAALIGTAGAAGYGLKTLTPQERQRLMGRLDVVALHPRTSGGCATDAQRRVALQDYLHDRARGFATRLLHPASAFARSEQPCQITAARWRLKNLIVNAGEAFLVDAWQNLVELEIMRYHGIGTGAVAAAEADTALGTELTTQYNPDNTRATGSLTEASASVFRTVGTNTVDASAAVTEWGVLSQAATGGGTLWSRVVFSVINLSAGDSLQTTYDLTVENIVSLRLLLWMFLLEALVTFPVAVRRRLRRRPTRCRLAGRLAAVVLLVFFFIAAPAWAYVETPTGVDVTVSYTEPTTTANGAPLTDLQKTSFYWTLDAGAESRVDVLATLGTGGTAITRIVSVPLAACKAGTVTVAATATNPFGDSVRSATVSLAVARVAGCAPVAPTNVQAK